MRKHHGQESRVYLSTGGASAATMVCSLSSFTMDMARDMAETTSYCDANKTYVPGKPNLTGSMAGFWDSESDVLFDAIDSVDPVSIIFYPSILVPEQYWYGNAFLSGGIESDVNSPVTVNADYSAASSWTRVGLAGALLVGNLGADRRGGPAGPDVGNRLQPA